MAGGGFSRGARIGVQKTVRSAHSRPTSRLPIYRSVPGHVFEAGIARDYPRWGHRVRASDSTQRTVNEVRNGAQRKYVEISVHITNDLLGDVVTVTGRTPAGLGAKLDRLAARWDRALARRDLKERAAALRATKSAEDNARRLAKSAAAARAKAHGTYRTNVNPYGDQTPKDDPLIAVRVDPESPKRSRVRLSLIERIARGASPAGESAVSDAYWAYVNCQNLGGQFLGIRCRETPHKHRVSILPQDLSQKAATLVERESRRRPARLIENRRPGGLQSKTRPGVKPLVQIQYCNSEQDAQALASGQAGYVHRWPFDVEPYIGAWVIAGGILAVVVSFGRGSYKGPTRQLDKFVGGDAFRSSVTDRLVVFREHANRSTPKQPWSARDHF
jgi:hypothetical protein